MIKTIKWLLIQAFIGILLFLTSCIEEFVPENITFENLLVVEATITDEFKFHQIELSRTFQFEEEPIVESQAEVSIIDDAQNKYIFNETEPGKYMSVVKFSAEPNKTYVLNILTKDNKSYSSSPVFLPDNEAQITEVSIMKSINSEGEDGIEILVDSFDPAGASNYYRFEYEETYRITAPLWSPDEAYVISRTPPFEIGIRPRTQPERICYNTIKNNVILQTQTSNFIEDRVSKFPLKFIPKNSPLLRDRYSILVKQFVQSLEAYTYYNTLNEFSNSESVFSENQPGFLDGNIFSTTDENEKVIGIFEVSSLKTERIYLEFESIYPNEGRAPYFIDCELFAPLLNQGGGSFSPLIDAIESNVLSFIDINLEPTEARPGPLLMTQTECGDCTVFGTNIKPDFWID